MSFLGDLLSDAARDTMNEFGKLFDDKSSENVMPVFSYNFLLKRYRDEYRRTPGIGSCRLQIVKDSDENGLVTCRDHWRVSLVFCDVKDQPLKKPNDDSYYGGVYICDSIDKKVSSLMDGQKAILFKPGPAELNQIKKRSVFDAIAEKISMIISDAVTVTVTVDYIKKFRERTGTKVVIAKMENVRMEASKQYKESYLDSIKVLDESEKYVIAEYDEKADEVVKVLIVKVDEKVKCFVDSNNGLVVIED